MKGSGEDESGIFFLKRDIHDTFQPVLACDHSQIIILYTSYIIQVYFTRNIFKQNNCDLFKSQCILFKNIKCKVNLYNTARV